MLSSSQSSCWAISNLFCFKIHFFYPILFWSFTLLCHLLRQTKLDTKTLHVSDNLQKRHRSDSLFLVHMYYWKSITVLSCRNTQQLNRFQMCSLHYVKLIPLTFCANDVKNIQASFENGSWLTCSNYYVQCVTGFQEWMWDWNTEKCIQSWSQLLSKMFPILLTS